MTAVLASVASGLAIAAFVRALAPPRRRLADRVRPYVIPINAALRRGVDPWAAGWSVGGSGPSAWLRAIAGPSLDRLGRLVDSTSDERMLLRFRHAGVYADVPEEQRVTEYRTRQLAATVGWGAASGITAAAVGLSTATVLLASVVGALGGSSRVRGRVDRAIADRRTRMRIELYTVDHLLAMHVRVGGGVVQAVQRVVERGRGPIVDELRDALITHASGVPVAEAFGRIAELTPEPAAARTYRLLAAGSEFGADLATGLLSLAENVRDVRRDALRREATKRRAAMLVPIIAILAPVMLLFIVAPLPSLIFDS